MKKRDNNSKAFLELVKAGLWGRDVQLFPFGQIDYSAIYKLAEEQSVIGLVAAGLEHVTDTKVPKDIALSFVGATLQLEQRNKAMNVFVGALVEKLRAAGLYPLLVKGQGIAQCYERPLWRVAGDIDLLLGSEDYERAKSYLVSNSTLSEEENVIRKHLALIIDSWEVELHGTLKSGLWSSLECTIDNVLADTFSKGRVRVWNNGGNEILLPGVDDDVVFVFAHILQHYFKEGIGIRQICDWCRLMWKFRNVIDNNLLEKRLKAMGAMSEWKAFSALAVTYLGMSEESIPLYSANSKWLRKANRIIGFILMTGNFGHNRDYSFYEKNPYVVCKIISLWRHTKDGLRYFFVFPIDALRLWANMLTTGIKEIINNRINCR